MKQSQKHVTMKILICIEVYLMKMKDRLTIENEIIQLYFNVIILSTFTLIKLQYSFIILFPRITLDWYNISNCKYMIWV